MKIFAPLSKLATVALILASVNAGASTLSSIALHGYVDANFSIDVVPDPAAIALDILHGENNKLIATVTEHANNQTGYMVYVRSVNGGMLRHDSNIYETVPYTITYGGGSSFTPQANPTQVRNSGPLYGAANVTAEVYMTFAPRVNALSGFYDDVLSFEIVAP